MKVKEYVHYIEWVDSMGGVDGCWVDKESLPKKPSVAHVVSVGFQYYDDEESVTLITSESEDQVCNGWLTIPKCCITRHRILALVGDGGKIIRQKSNDSVL